MRLRRGRGRRPGLPASHRTGRESTLVAVAVADPDQEQRATQVQRSITAAYRRGEPPSDETLRAASTYSNGTGDRGAAVT